MGSAGKLLSLAMHPESAEGERGIDGGLRFFAAHS